MGETSTLQRAFADGREGDALLEAKLQQDVLGALFGEAAGPLTYDRFVILERVGAGAMGTVYSAYDPKLDRRVALKVMSSASSVARARHLEEARALARLSHPNVVVVHDAGECAGSVFVAMEFVEGCTLEAHLHDADPDPDRIVALFVEAARGLSAAHRAGVIHRDFKPTNALLGDDGRVRVADFGLARTTELDTEDGPEPDAAEAVSAIAGTPFYMAPEQRERGVANVRTDQYAFCVALREALGGGEVGKLPVSRRRRQAIARGLSERPSERFASMDGLIAALEPPRRAPAWALGAVGLAVGSVAWAATPDVDPCSAAEAPAAELWTPARRADLAAAFTSSDAPNAEVLAGRITERLDAYAEQLTQAHREVCEVAGRGEYAEDDRVQAQQCLARTRTRFEATLDLLSEATDARLAAAHPLVSALPDADDCARVDPLRQSVLPADPQRRAEVLALEVALDDVAARELVGEAIGDDEIAALRARVDATGYGPLQAEFEYTVGITRQETPESEPALRRALWKAEALGETSVAASAAEALAKTAQTEGRRGDARIWVDLGKALHRRAGRPTSPRLAEVETSMALEAVDLEAAAEHLEVYADVATVDTDRLGVLLLRAELALANRDAEGAFVTLDEAMALALRFYGPGSDAEATTLVKRGTAGLQLERPEPAAADLEAALAILQRTADPQDARLLAVRNRLAFAQQALGRYDAAVESYVALEATIAERFGVPHPATMGIRRNLARAHHEAGDDPASLRMCLAAREAAPEDLGSEHRLDLDLCEATARRGVGEPRVAAELLAPWLDISDLADPAAVRFGYGLAQHAAGEVDEGLKWVRSAIEPAREVLEPGQLSEPELWLREHGEPPAPG